MKPNALVIDDSLSVRMDLRSALGAAGFLVTACDTIAAAHRALRSRVYALVILDVILPDGDGINLLRELRADPDLHMLPIILLSTEAQVASRIRGLTTGADEYIGKPYDRDYLVQRACTLGQREDALDAPSSQRWLSGKRVLLVDDSEIFLRSLSEQLRREGADVIPARSGEEALDLLAVQPVDGVVLDLVMPGVDGIETCRRIRAMPGGDRTPVVILTGSDAPAAHRAGLAAGADDFVVKSPQLDVLRVRLRGALRRKTEDLPVPVPVSERRHPMASAAASAATLFEQVVIASGLSDLIGPGAIHRACRRAGVDPGTMTAADLQRALPAIRAVLSVFHPDDEATRRAEMVQALARSTPAGPR
jgi:DNA-binding response OmpR family regulator